MSDGIHDIIRDAVAAQALAFDDALLTFAAAGCGMDATYEIVTGPGGDMRLTCTYTAAPDLPPLDVRDDGINLTYRQEIQ